jgi:hypothetical protein
MNTRLKYGALIVSLWVLFHLSGCAGTRTTAVEPPQSRPVTETENTTEKTGTLTPSVHRDRTWFVLPGKLNLRVCAGLNCLVSATLNRGDELFQTGEKGGWIRVRVKTTRKEGWVSSTFLGKKSTVTVAASTPPQ